MPQVIFSPAALRDLERLRAFLRPKDPAAAKRAAAAILQTIQTLTDHPEMGRPIGVLDERELRIDFGRDGYVALYRYDGGVVVVLGVRHGREAGFAEEARRQSQTVAQADAADHDLQDFMDAALRDQDDQ
ncbi:antitoxin MazE-like protein [Breoghania sp. JC706]|uniref:antitoxin MazE-like protein n=1 Tax=Breoghania sp. JC706 TaxID=3117732 RepID=UPI003008E113